MTALRLGTRGSALARTQSGLVAAALTAQNTVAVVNAVRKEIEAQKAKAAGVTNVQAIAGEATDPKLPEPVDVLRHLRRRRQERLDLPRVLWQVLDISSRVVVTAPYRKRASNSPELSDRIAGQNRRSTEHLDSIECFT